MILGVVWSACCDLATAQAAAKADAATLNELKAAGALRSSYRMNEVAPAPTVAPTADLVAYRKDIEPILAKACYACHGPDKQKGELRIDTLDADLFAGRDVDWWLDVLAVLNNGEMPPEDSDVELQDNERSKVVTWLAGEIQTASSVRRATTRYSSFRRMTRYEYNYALQDLLGLPYDFAGDLPPDPSSKDGFENSSEVLHMMGGQFRAYLDAGRKALRLATVSAEQPEPMFWGVSMAAAAAGEWQKQDQQFAKLREKHKDDPAKMEAELQALAKRFANRPNAAYYLRRSNHLDRGRDRVARQSWGYNGAKFAFAPTTSLPELPTAWDCVAVLPPSKGLIVELGDQIPDIGTLRVGCGRRVRPTAPGLRRACGCCLAGRRAMTPAPWCRFRCRS
jgi:mono/diheme cytochrome c family protein